MNGFDLHLILFVIQKSISLVGVLIIFSGIISALILYFKYLFNDAAVISLNDVRLNLGRVLLLGLEFIVAADLIGTTTTPDYYALGILAIIVVIRTVLSFTLNREIMYLSQER